jgi:hypothetical protein
MVLSQQLLILQHLLLECGSREAFFSFYLVSQMLGISAYVDFGHTIFRLFFFGIL